MNKVFIFFPIFLTSLIFAQQLPQGTLEKVLTEQIRRAKPVVGISFSPDGKTLASKSSNGNVIFWNLEDASIVHKIKGSTSNGSAVYISETVVAVSKGKSEIFLYDLSKKEEIFSKMFTGIRISDISAYGSKVAIAGGGSKKAMDGQGGYVILWDTQTGQSSFVKTEGRNASCYGVSFSPNGKFVAFGDRNAGISLWEVSGKKVTRLVKDHIFDVGGNKSNLILSTSFSPDGKYVIGGGYATKILVWDLESKKRMHVLSHEKEITSVVFSPNSEFIASTSKDETICIWNVKSGFKTSLKGNEHGSPNAALFSPDGQHVAVGTEKGAVVIWKLTSK